MAGLPRKRAQRGASRDSRQDLRVAPQAAAERGNECIRGSEVYSPARCPGNNATIAPPDAPAPAIKHGLHSAAHRQHRGQRRADSRSLLGSGTRAGPDTSGERWRRDTRALASRVRIHAEVSLATTHDVLPMRSLRSRDQPIFADLAFPAHPQRDCPVRLEACDTSPCDRRRRGEARAKTQCHD